MDSLPEFLRPLLRPTIPFPAEAVAAALARREESVPHLLQSLEHTARIFENEELGENWLFPHFAMHLLAQMEETRAHAPIVAIARSPEADAFLGQTITESLGSILALTSGGDSRQIESILEDESLDEWVRGAAARALGVLLRRGAKARAEVSAYVGRLLGPGGLRREPGNQWDNLVALCADFGFAEHRELIRQAYAEGLADEYYDNLADVEEELDLLPGVPGKRTDLGSYADIDTVQEMQHWVCFRSAEGRRKSAKGKSRFAALKAPFASPAYEPAKPYVREAKVGRNDPCPCGSGKKFKKCCG